MTNPYDGLIERLEREQVLVSDQEPFVEIWETDFIEIMAGLKDLSRLTRDVEEAKEALIGARMYVQAGHALNLLAKIDTTLTRLSCIDIKPTRRHRLPQPRNIGSLTPSG